MSNLEHGVALYAAIDRDIRDTERLARFQALLTDMMDAIMHDTAPLEHPLARWQPANLVRALERQMLNIERERQRYRAPVVLGD